MRLPQAASRPLRAGPRATFPTSHPQTSLMIGDSLSDIEFGSRLGMPTIFIEGDPTRQKSGADRARLLIAASPHSPKPWTRSSNIQAIPRISTNGADRKHCFALKSAVAFVSVQSVSALAFSVQPPSPPRPLPAPSSSCRSPARAGR